MTKSPKPMTKKTQLIQMLTRKAGADVAAISGRLGWQAHTTRAAITGLRKAGYEVAADKESGKPARYRITAKPLAKAARPTGAPASEPADAG